MVHIKTDAISVDAIVSLVNAFAYAEQTGTPFTVFFAIAWSKTRNWSDDKLADKQEAFARKLRKWLNERNIPVAYAYVGEVGGKVGVHTNVAVHIPKMFFMEFQGSLDDLVPGFIGNPCTTKLFEDQRSQLPKLHDHPNQRLGSFKYMLKGIDPNASFNANGQRVKWCKAIGIRPEPQGIIVGRRTGVSHTLGKVARANAGWVDRTAPAAIAEALTPLPKAADDSSATVLPITPDIEAQVDRDQLSGRLGFEWVPPSPGLKIL